MKKIIVLISISFLFFQPIHFTATMLPQIQYDINKTKHIAQPPYAKWGRMAMEKTKEKYPRANIVDYEHLGRVHGVNTNMERFKLWLKEEDKEFGVIVQIEFDKQTERVIKISFREVDR